MLWNNFKIAAALFFSWFIVDSVSSIFLRSPLDGIYYPLTSGRLRHIPRDWTDKTCFEAPLYLFLFSIIWLFFIRKEGTYKGMRLAAIFTSFILAPFWIVSSVSASMYGLDINIYWLLTMIYSNISFLVFGFIGNGNIDDLNF